MNNKVFFVQDFHEVPAKIEDLINQGYTVYNASRPLLGHETWQGDFRHGIFYAAVAPDELDEFGDAPAWHKRNQELDGSVCQIFTHEDVMAYGAMVAEEYGVDLAGFDYEDVVKSFIGWLNRRNES